MTKLPKNQALKPHHTAIVSGVLLAGETINQHQFCDITSKSSRLAPRILDLKKQGYPIAKHRLNLSDGTHVADYYLPTYFLTNVRQYGLDKALNIELSKKMTDKELERV